MTYPPAGWYSDPYNPHELRWWDGRAWGQVASTVPVAPLAYAPPTPDPAPDPAAPAAAPPARNDRSLLGPVIGAVMTLAIIGLTSAVVVLAKDNSDKNAAGDSAPVLQTGTGGPGSASPSPSASGSSSGSPFALHQSCVVDAHDASYTTTLTNHTDAQLEVDELTTAFFTAAGAQISTHDLTVHQVIQVNQRVTISSKVGHARPPAGSATCTEIAADVIANGDDLTVNWPARP